MTFLILSIYRLKMILRQLQISSFGGKMNALNEVNRVIASVSYYPNQGQPQPQPQPSQKGSGEGSSTEEDFLTADRMAAWLKENKVLQIGTCFHHCQNVSVISFYDYSFLFFLSFSFAR